MLQCTSLFVEEQRRRGTRYSATQWEGIVWLKRVGGKAIGPVFTEFVSVFTVQASGLFCCFSCLLDDIAMVYTNVCNHGSFRFSNAMLYPTTPTSVAWPVPHDAYALYLHHHGKWWLQSMPKCWHNFNHKLGQKTWKLKLHTACRLQKCKDNNRVEINFLH